MIDMLNNFRDAFKDDIDEMINTKFMTMDHNEFIVYLDKKFNDMQKHFNNEIGKNPSNIFTEKFDDFKNDIFGMIDGTSSSTMSRSSSQNKH